MKIAYRRMSGAIGISQFEQGTRGMWWEKRNALVKWLRSRGHTVDFVNRMTKFSPQITKEYDNHDLLMIEFGSRNTVFYGADLGETIRLVDVHQGPIIFLCDDPDLPFIWKSVGPSNLKKFTVWSNCLFPQEDKTLPWGIIAKDFPFSALQPSLDATPRTGQELVYIGRPNGRDKVLQLAIESKVPIAVYAKPAEWTDYPFRCHEPPAQTERAVFYNISLACLAIADSKHKKLGWRTGRAYHAALAGCPVIAEADHPGLQGFSTFSNATELREFYDQVSDPAMRLRLVERQKIAIADDHAICETRAKEMGL